MEKNVLDDLLNCPGLISDSGRKRFKTAQTSGSRLYGLHNSISVSSDIAWPIFYGGRLLLFNLYFIFLG